MFAAAGSLIASRSIVSPLWKLTSAIGRPRRLSGSWPTTRPATRATLPVQNLQLGVNVHINYDLVLTLDDLLRPEWPDMSEEQRATRFGDYCHVNDIIGRTINDVQDQVLEPAMSAMDIVDKLSSPRGYHRLTELSALQRGY